jgi:hypothetical protein
VSDIIGCRLKTGRFLAIEVKRPGGKPTPEQQQFIDTINHAGGLAFVARSIEEVEQHWNGNIGADNQRSSGKRAA